MHEALVQSPVLKKKKEGERERERLQEKKAEIQLATLSRRPCKAGRRGQVLVYMTSVDLVGLWQGQGEKDELVRTYLVMPTILES
jgi:hypothetical protein